MSRLKKKEDEDHSDEREDRKPSRSNSRSSIAMSQTRPSSNNQSYSMYSQQNPYSMNQLSGQGSTQSSNGLGSFIMGSNPLSSQNSLYGNTDYSMMGSPSYYLN